MSEQEGPRQITPVDSTSHESTSSDHDAAWSLQNNGSQATSPSPKASASPPVRPSMLNRMSFGRSKGLRDVAIEDLEKRHRAEKAETKARKEVDKKERKARQETEKQQGQRERSESRERAKQEKEDKTLKKAKEKKVKKFYGIRGFDPDAGMLHSNRERVASREIYEHDQVHQGTHVPSNPYLPTGETWGLEHGRPKEHDGKGHYSGQHDKCGHGSSAAVGGCQHMV